jgi:hypothetical protein
MTEINKQPENCPEPKGMCPMYSPDFISRLLKIEEEISESRKYRTERNEIYSKFMDEMRITMYEHDDEIKELRGMHKELIDALMGVMGRSGLISETVEHEARITVLENWKREIKAFIAGAIAICSVVSAGMTYLVVYLKGH